MGEPPGIPAIPPDAQLPEARGLFVEDGPRAVASFLQAQGWSVQGLRAVQAFYSPGSSCLVRYRVNALDPDGSGRVLSICGESRARRRDPPPPTVPTSAACPVPEPVAVDGPYLIWAFPYDPSLPALPAASWGPAVREAMGRSGDRPLAVTSDCLRYRPRRRAVFRYLSFSRAGGRRRRTVLFGKVLRTEKAARWAGARGHGAHRVPWAGRRPRVRLALPTGVTDDGLVLLPALPGRSLRDLLLAGDSLPSPDRIAGLLHELGPQARGVAEGRPWLAARHAPTDLARRAGALLRAIVPEAGGEIDTVLEAVAEGERGSRSMPRLVHGDLYEAQVFVDDDFTLGLIDLDDLGPGDPALDAANCTAHLLALALSVPAAADRLVAYRSLLREAFRARLQVSSAELAWREALAMLLLATGPFRVLVPAWPREVHRRVRLAVRLLATS